MAVRKPKRCHLLIAVLVGVLALAGCANAGIGATIACEEFIDRRVGMELEHDGDSGGAVVEGEGPFVVASAYTEPLTRRRVTYTCTVEKTTDGWRLIDLSANR